MDSITDSYSSVISNEMNNIMKTLTLFTVFLTVPTLVFSFFWNECLYTSNFMGGNNCFINNFYYMDSAGVMEKENILIYYNFKSMSISKPFYVRIDDFFIGKKLRVLNI
ncbi:hypothetical protein BHL37_25290 [Bacillus cereus]|nr:hypothetical protein BHL37_25290 [Bacillus cereus]